MRPRSWSKFENANRNEVMASWYGFHASATAQTHRGEKSDAADPEESDARWSGSDLDRFTECVAVGDRADCQTEWIDGGIPRIHGDLGVPEQSSPRPLELKPEKPGTTFKITTGWVERSEKEEVGLVGRPE